MTPSTVTTITPLRTVLYLDFFFNLLYLEFAFDAEYLSFPVFIVRGGFKGVSQSSSVYKRNFVNF
jgi:hypothetical protein